MLDFMILCIVSWASVIGWKRGGFRSLIDVMSVGSAIAVVVLSIPIVRDWLIDSSWALEFRMWLQEHLRAVPTGIGMTEAGMAADRLYHMVIVGIGSLTIWAGIQMILHVYLTVLREPAISVFSRLTGSLLGVFMGGIFVSYMIQCLGSLSWIQGFEALDLYLARSVFVWIVMNLLVS